MKTYKLKYEAFYQIKRDLDGRIFWRKDGDILIRTPYLKIQWLLKEHEI